MKIDKRNEDRIKAEELYLKSKGKIELVKIAEKINRPPGTIRGWKSKDKWDDKLNGTFQNKTERSNDEKNVKDIDDNGDRSNKDKASKQATQTNTKKQGAPKGNKNAVGNRGGTGGPKRNKHAETHGFFSKYLPEETLELTQEIKEKPYIDILWENITIQYAAIIRAQRIMYVKDQEDTTKIIKKEKSHQSEMSDSSEVEYIHHMSWDKQATFLQAQSRAMGELRSMIKQYDELVDNELATEEQILRIKKLKADITRVEGNEDAMDKLDELIEAVNNEAKS